MNFGISSSILRPSTLYGSPVILSRICCHKSGDFNPFHLFPKTNLHVRAPNRHSVVRCQNSSPWEPSPEVAYSTEEGEEEESFLNKTANIFDTLTAESETEAQTINETLVTSTGIKEAAELLFLRWPQWVMGPCILLATGMVPTLWLPLSSVFLGANIASLLSLVGLDCIFNLGVTLFLLMADSSARPSSGPRIRESEAPSGYRLWNMLASFAGFLIPAIVLLGSRKGILQPQLSFIPAAVLLGPYALLLFVQVLTEALTWHWRSPVWLVTPVVYEAYRILQLMRGLKLGAEMTAPGWMLNMIRGLVCWWVLVLGVQLMRVAWFAGTVVRPRQQPSSSDG
ncbi:hypothetical protein MLD38_038504 [Melastoma candidum]|uniref:Uncharacterized protein n=1 Tax=Melastoma candidum TaxID=119954 RepID=A0ACB9KZ40_9MYRT|nr:hypothetical protein MLD38_038504 [Melastoma candidum]